jgi:ribosomal protein S18 acetylase RimI-like enzyme
MKTKIEKGQLRDLDELFQIYLNAKNDLEQSGIYQWTNNYPTKSIIENDLIQGVLYTLKNNHEIIGAINISEEQEAEYQSIHWDFDDSKVLVIHRLVIDPKYQRRGYARKMMDYAEQYATENNYSSIRLDAYSQNPSVVELYKRRGYHIRGSIHFPERKHPFYGMEKEIV